MYMGLQIGAGALKDIDGIRTLKITVSIWLNTIRRYALCVCKAK